MRRRDREVLLAVIMGFLLGSLHLALRDPDLAPGLRKALAKLSL